MRSSTRAHHKPLMNRATEHPHKKPQSSLSMKFNMEQCFRIALWVFLLIGYLQAASIKVHLLTHLHEVKCGQNNLTYPTNVEGHCSQAALKSYKAELLRAKTEICEDENNRIGDILFMLDTAITTSAKSSECNMTTTETNFGDFMKNLTNLLQRLNNERMGHSNTGN